MTAAPLPNEAEFQKTVLSRLDDLNSKVSDLETDVERFNDRLENHEKGMRWVVQLSFSLLISATVALVISALSLLLRS